MAPAAWLADVVTPVKVCEPAPPVIAVAAVPEFVCAGPVAAMLAATLEPVVVATALWEAAALPLADGAVEGEDPSGVRDAACAVSSRRG